MPVIVGRVCTTHDRPYVYQEEENCGTLLPDRKLPGGQDHGANPHESFERSNQKIECWGK